MLPQLVFYSLHSSFFDPVSTVPPLCASLQFLVSPVCSIAWCCLLVIRLVCKDANHMACVLVRLKSNRLNLIGAWMFRAVMESFLNTGAGAEQAVMRAHGAL